MPNQTVAAGVASESAQPGHVVVDLFQGWSTEAPSSASTGAASDVAMHLKRSSSHEGSLNTATAASAFQSISFPSRDTGSTVALYAGTTQEEEELERIKLLPPSKRPGVSHAKKTPPNHIKRPRNAYIIFRSHTVSQKLIPKEVEHDHRNISRIIAHMWKSLSPEDRAHYEQIAKEEKERHKLLFPNYRYQPTTRREGVSKRNVKKLENGEEECQEIADIILKAQGKDGVIVRAGPSKAIKRAREATRSSRVKSTTAKPPRKRARTTKSTHAEPVPAEQTLETVFLHPSPTHSPTSTSSAGCGAVPAPSPEAFRLSRTSSIDEGEGHALAETSPRMDHLLERRASSVPLFRPCSPPPPFALESPPSLVEGAQTSDAPADVAHGVVGLVGPSVMPAPAWKGRKAQPAPIPNTWQHCSYDDQSLPSPRSFAALGSGGKTPMSRPRTAYPSTPSSGSFRGFFHPWAYEEGTESMLISPMTASFQDLRRRSSLARSGLVAGRRPGSFGFDSHSYAAGRGEMDVRSHGLGETEERSFPGVPLFDQAVQAAALSLESEASAGDVVEASSFAFDPALGGEGCEPVSSSTYASQYGHASLPSIRSPRASFSGSTLAAAARDWASMKRRRSKLEHLRSIEPVSDSVSTSTESSTSDDQARIEAAPRATDKAVWYRPSLEESVERAVMLALGKDTGSGNERGGRNSKIVQQILSSLSAELSLQQLPAYPRELESTSPALRPMASKPSSFSLAGPSRRSSLRNSCGLLPSHKPSQYGSSSSAAEPLPSPLQLIMSNHELSSEAYSHSHPSSQHLVRGPKHHLKRLNAPSSWMLDKLSGTYAPRPSNGPHKLREALPLVILLRNRLKYALTGREVNAITAQRLIKIDGKVRTDPTYPTGFQDVVSIEKSGEHFRILYDVKGRFIVHRITAEEATYKLLKVKKVQLGARGVPHIVTHDGRTIRYPDPAIKVNDTVRFDIESQKILDFVAFDTGATVMVTGGRNQGRAGVITGKERHLGGFDIVHIRDVLGRDFSTRLGNVFVIGSEGKPMISMPRGGGVKLTITEERDQRRRQKEARGQ